VKELMFLKILMMSWPFVPESSFYRQLAIRILDIHELNFEGLKFGNLLGGFKGGKNLVTLGLSVNSWVVLGGRRLEGLT